MSIINKDDVQKWKKETSEQNTFRRPNQKLREAHSQAAYSLIKIKGH